MDIVRTGGQGDFEMSDKKLMSVMFAAAIGVATVAAGAASAAPFQVPQVAAPESSGPNVVKVQYRDRYSRPGGFGGSPGIVYYNGHRGYRNYHPGYRRHGDFWFPPAAFALGAIIGGAIATAPSYDDGYYRPRYYERRVVPGPSYDSGSAHVRWCYNRYRSYRAWDNTFQPYHGPRQQCISPYG
jgi:hypothetical protein